MKSYRCHYRPDFSVRIRSPSSGMNTNIVEMDSSSEVTCGSLVMSSAPTNLATCRPSFVHGVSEAPISFATFRPSLIHGVSKAPIPLTTVGVTTCRTFLEMWEQAEPTRSCWLCPSRVVTSFTPQKGMNLYHRLYLTESVSKVVRKSQLSHKSVNLFVILVILKDKLTSLCGIWLLQNNIIITFCEIRPGRSTSSLLIWRSSDWRRQR